MAGIDDKGPDDLEEYLGRVKKAFPEVLLRGIFSAAQHLAGEIRRTIMEGPLSSFPGVVRTGNLARSFKESFTETDGVTVGAKAVSDLVYAGIQDQGGRIRKKSRRLAIPLVPLPVGKWPRTFPRGELVKITSKRGNDLLVRIRRKATKGRPAIFDPVFLLRDFVDIPPKHYIDRTWQREGDIVTEMLGDSSVQVFQV